MHVQFTTRFETICARITLKVVVPPETTLIPPAFRVRTTIHAHTTRFADALCARHAADATARPTKTLKLSFCPFLTTGAQVPGDGTRCAAYARGEILIRKRRRRRRRRSSLASRGAWARVVAPVGRAPFVVERTNDNISILYLFAYRPCAEIHVGGDKPIFLFRINDKNSSSVYALGLPKDVLFRRFSAMHKYGD